MVYFQQSLFGKTSWERFHQMTGWILEPSYPLSQTPMFQCLLLEDGQEPEWCEGERLTSAGGSWTPSIGQAPGWHDGSASFLWQTLEDGVPTKYFLSPAQCSHFLRLAEIAGCPPPAVLHPLPFGMRTILPGAASAFPRKRNVNGSWGYRRAGQGTARMARKFCPPTVTGHWETPSRCPAPSISWRGSWRR